jgi:hypothetical protein
MPSRRAASAPVDLRLPGARHPKRFCEVCLQFDDHPRIVMGVTTEGPLGNHTAEEIGRAAALITPLLPANMAEVETRLAACETPAQREQVYLDLVPDPDEYDAARAWHQFLHQQHFDAHLDCYIGLPAHVQPQLAIDAWDPDGNQVSWEDKRKIMPSGHAQTGAIELGLKGDKLRAHLVRADPGVDHGHGAKR